MILAQTVDPTSTPMADFSQDTVLVVLVKAVLVFAFLVLTTLVVIWAERRIIGRMQQRPGPNRAGPFGILQSLADGIKLALKEDIIPSGADRVMFLLAPAIAAAMAFVSFSVIPFGPTVRIPFTDVRTPLQMTDTPVATLLVLAVASVGVYGIVLAGWSSSSTYPLLGGLRSSAQVISYEIAMGLALVAVFLFSGSMSTSQIVASQRPLWWIVVLFPSFVIYVITMVGETNRLPFDLAEGEGELTGGFHTEYSSLKFALFFLAEYVNMVTVSALATTLFLGGWRAPWPLSIWHGANSGWWPVLWFVAKLWMFLFFFIWLRGSLPRVRYDQFMRFGWKVLIPSGLVWIIAVAVIQGVRLFTDASRTRTLVVIGAVAAVALAAGWAFDVRRERRAQRSGTAYGWQAGEVDPFAGGYPVPPLPGQSVRSTDGAGSRTFTGATAAPEAITRREVQEAQSIEDRATEQEVTRGGAPR